MVMSKVRRIESVSVVAPATFSFSPFFTYTVKVYGCFFAASIRELGRSVDRKYELNYSATQNISEFGILLFKLCGAGASDESCVDRRADRIRQSILLCVVGGEKHRQRSFYIKSLESLLSLPLLAQLVEHLTVVVNQ